METREYKKLDCRGGVYRINSKISFGTGQGFIVKPNDEIIKKVMLFSWQMTFGEQGAHREYRSGGDVIRNKSQIFRDVFLGKMGEVAFHEYAVSGGALVNEIDFSCYQRGKWDQGDFVAEYNNRKYSIAVKSTKDYGNLLLLEKKDWVLKDDGVYYVCDNPHIKYDFIVFCRIRSSLPDFTDDDQLCNYFHNYPRENQSDISDVSLNVACEVVGYINNRDLATIIGNNNIIGKGDYLQSKRIEMDADNYYAQSGCIRRMRRMRGMRGE